MLDFVSLCFVRKIQKGKNYIIYASNDSLQSIKYFVYENDPIDFVIIDFADSIEIFTGSKPIDIKVNRAEGEIKTSLYLTLKEQNDPAPPELIDPRATKVVPRRTHEL